MVTQGDIILPKPPTVMAQALIWRTVTIALGALGIIWGGVLLPRFWQAASRNHIAAEFVQGHVFTEEVMVQSTLQTEPDSHRPYAILLNCITPLYSTSPY